VKPEIVSTVSGFFIGNRYIRIVLIRLKKI